MKRYSIVINLTNGDKVDAKVVGENQADAVSRLICTNKFKEFTKGTDVKNINISFIEDVKNTIKKSNYVLQKSKDTGWWVVTDKINKIVVKFRQNEFNSTAFVTPLYDLPDESVEVATILREIGEFLATYHKDII